MPTNKPSAEVLSTKKQGKQTVVLIRIKNCSRCGKNHNSLEFKEFKSGPQVVHAEPYTSWAMCPVRREPILLSMYLNPAKAKQEPKSYDRWLKKKS